MLTWLTESIPSRPLGLTRIVVGTAATIRALVAIPVVTKLTRPETLLLPYSDWLPAPTPLVVWVILAVWLVAAVLFSLGWRVALTGSVLTLAIITNLLLDRQTYSNHLYLMVWLVALLTLAGAGSGLSISGAERTVVRWPVVLIMAQVSIVYGFSAITKINDEFLSGEVLARVLTGGLIPLPSGLRTPEFLSTLALLVIAVELFIAFFLWSRRFRPFAFLLGLGLHISIVLLMPDTGELAVFGLEMLAVYPLFLGAAAVHIVAPQIWAGSIRRYNLIRLVDVAERGQGEMELIEKGTTLNGAAAHTRALERLVPWLWVAPILRLPGISHLHAMRHHDHTPAHQTGSP